MLNKGVGGGKSGRGGSIGIGGAGGIGGALDVKRAERDLVLRMIQSMRFVCGGVKEGKVFDVSS
jgi:hypothetical protein